MEDDPPLCLVHNPLQIRVSQSPGTRHRPLMLTESVVEMKLSSLKSLALTPGVLPGIPPSLGRLPRWPLKSPRYTILKPLDLSEYASCCTTWYILSFHCAYLSSLYWQPMYNPQMAVFDDCDSTVTHKRSELTKALSGLVISGLWCLNRSPSPSLV